MKRFLLFIVFALSAFMVSAKQPKSLIYYDKVENDGSRVILSKYTVGLEVGLTGVMMLRVNASLTSDNLYSYSVGVSLRDVDHPTIDSERSLMFKLESGEIVELKNFNVVGIADYEIVQTSMITYEVNPIYTITSEQLDKIINGNVVKIRLETDDKNVDIKVKGNKVSTGIKQAYDAVAAALAVKKDKYSDF